MTDKKILIAFILNLFFSIFEFIGGIITGSVAITSDSIHDLGDALSIGISYILEKKSKRKPDEYHTYGYIRYSVIGSIITTTILLTGSIFVIYESIKRIINPTYIDYNGMIIFSIVGIIVNLLASYITEKGESLNQKSVNLHMLEDVLGWIVVLVGSILMKITNISLLDSILSILVALFILVNAIKNLKVIIDIFLEVTPKNININDLKKQLLKIEGVIDTHHIHIRSIDGYNNYATLHIVVEKYSEKIKKEVKEKLEEEGICHSTIELELKEEHCDNSECKIKDELETKHHHHHH